MLPIQSRYSKPLTPLRTIRPATSKLIFLSCEGSVTEEEYFKIVSSLYKEVQTKIQFISVVKDIVERRPNKRTPEQNRVLSKTRPIQLVQRIDDFIEANEEQYQFSQYPEDEFWVVTDVDNNWSSDIISVPEHKSYLDERNDAIKQCKQKGYHYAVSNPFFELWLLLHHDDVTDEDKSFAVTDTHPYEPTSHFISRLDTLKVPLKRNNHKKIIQSDYTKENITHAVERAKLLHINSNDLAPKYLATTVYMLVEKIIEVSDSLRSKEQLTIESTQ